MQFRLVHLPQIEEGEAQGILDLGHPMLIGRLLKKPEGLVQFRQGLQSPTQPPKSQGPEVLSLSVQGRQVQLIQQGFQAFYLLQSREVQAPV
jgi:hypothetical protein